MNIIKALESLAGVATALEAITNQIAAASTLIINATREGRDLTESEVKQVVARADMAREALEEVLSL